MSFFVFGRQILFKNSFQIVVAWSGIDVAVSAQLFIGIGITADCVFAWSVTAFNHQPEILVFKLVLRFIH